MSRVRRPPPGEGRSHQAGRPRRELLRRPCHQPHRPPASPRLHQGRRSPKARLLTGGEAIHREGGYYIAPTVFTDVAPTARIALEEIFGPVLAVIPSTSFDHALGNRQLTPSTASPEPSTPVTPPSSPAPAKSSTSATSTSTANAPEPWSAHTPSAASTCQAQTPKPVAPTTCSSSPRANPSPRSSPPHPAPRPTCRSLARASRNKWEQGRVEAKIRPHHPHRATRVSSRSYPAFIPVPVSRHSSSGSDSLPQPQPSPAAGGAA